MPKAWDSSFSLFKRFSELYTKVNSSKSHLVMSGKQSVIDKNDNIGLGSENLEELLGIHLDSTFTFENHKICQKASQN